MGSELNKMLKAGLVNRVRRNLANLEFHLAGQHDQASHGNWAGEGDEPSPSSSAKTIRGEHYGPDQLKEIAKWGRKTGALKPGEFFKGKKKGEVIARWQEAQNAAAKVNTPKVAEKTGNLIFGEKANPWILATGPYKVTVDGQTYDTSEMAFHAAKTDDPVKKALIANAQARPGKEDTPRERSLTAKLMSKVKPGEEYIDANGVKRIAKKSSTGVDGILTAEEWEAWTAKDPVKVRTEIERAKFDQNTVGGEHYQGEGHDLKKLLIETGDAVIREPHAIGGDTWGYNKETGANGFGDLLMGLRDEYNGNKPVDRASESRANSDFAKWARSKGKPVLAEYIKNHPESLQENGLPGNITGQESTGYQRIDEPAKRDSEYLKKGEIPVMVKASNGRWYRKDYFYFPKAYDPESVRKESQEANTAVQGDPLLRDQKGTEAVMRKPRGIRDKFKELWANTPENERKAISNYMENSTAINSRVAESRAGKPLSKADRETVDALESALSNAPKFREPVTLWRGFDLNPGNKSHKELLDKIYALGEKPNQSESEKEALYTKFILDTVRRTPRFLNSPGLTSTSLDPKVAVGFANNQQQVPQSEKKAVFERNKYQVIVGGGPFDGVDFGQFGGVLIKINNATRGAYVAPNGTGLKPPARKGKTRGKSESAATGDLRSQEEVILPTNSELRPTGVVRNVRIGSKRYVVVEAEQVFPHGEGVRTVRTPEGAAFYGLPIGSPIVADKEA